ncbi:hypothetical protein GCM10027615_30620 [Plantactinospora veratri]
MVSPQQVLEQFQRELWTRFAIPLVRLDSTGIQRIQQEIPAGRNPFTYFKRAIISVDTLKDAGQFGHHLDAIEWDAVVIDESHNLINKGTQRNELARRLAAKTDALLLASATPHNGDKRSFAELISLLDPAAITDPDDYTAEDIAHLYLRRTKISPEVRDQIGNRWADRGPSRALHCPASDAEERIFAELTEVWLAGEWTDAPLRGQDRLFPYTLLKSFLSSHVALAATVANRSKKATGRERAALDRLAELTAEMSDDDSSKLDRLVAELRDKIGVGPGSSVRAVVFSERVPTLKWLAEVVPRRLGLKPSAVRTLHGGLTDAEEQQVLQEFELAGSAVRLLFTGDVASEGEPAPAVPPPGALRHPVEPDPDRAAQRPDRPVRPAARAAVPGADPHLERGGRQGRPDGGGEAPRPGGGGTPQPRQRGGDDWPLRRQAGGGPAGPGPAGGQDGRRVVRRRCVRGRRARRPDGLGG